MAGRKSALSTVKYSCADAFESTRNGLAICASLRFLAQYAWRSAYTCCKVANCFSIWSNSGRSESNAWPAK